MKDNQSFYDFISAYPIVEAKDCVKQDTIKKAAELLSQQTKYVGAKQNFVLNQLKSISKVFWFIQFICFLLLFLKMFCSFFFLDPSIGCQNFHVRNSTLPMLPC